MQILTYLLARFSEPSSYAGLGAALALLGLNLSDPALAGLTQFFAAACGLVAMFLKERGLIAIVLAVLAIAPVLTACGAITAADAIIPTPCGGYGKARGAADLVAAAGMLPSVVVAKVTSIESFGDLPCITPPAGDPLSAAIWLGRFDTVTKGG